MERSIDVLPAPRLLKTTTSRCTRCFAPAPAEVLAAGGKVFLRRICNEHGATESVLSSDERLYHVALGERNERSSTKDTTGSCCRSQAVPRDDRFTMLSTCLALIEVIDSCNLSCPTCFADSPLASSVRAPSLEDLQRRIAGVIERKGEIEILQLSGGEPTLHPEFFELLAWVQDHPDIGYVLINTNGVRFARQPDFAADFDRLYRRGKVQLYLQHDGPQEAGQRDLRGADLRRIREDVLEVTGKMDGGGLPVTLAMTVTPETLPYLWATIETGLHYPHVRGVTFQPLFHSGRLPTPSEDGGPETRLDAATVVLAAIEQSGGVLRRQDFTPLPCGDPNCATIGYLLRLPDGLHSISEFIDFSALSGFLERRLDYDLADLERCGCESEPLGHLLQRLEVSESHTFRLFVKPFMDAWSWDEDRIDRCCTHVIRPDGELDSFCRYYSGFPGTWNGSRATRS